MLGDQAQFEAVSSPWTGAAIEEVKARLKRTIAGAGLSQREVERRLGWGEGYISQILRGKVAFKFKHCFAILAAVGAAPAELLLTLRGPGEAPEPRSPLAGLSAAGAPGAAGAAGELRAEVEKIVRELLAGRDQPAGGSQT